MALELKPEDKEAKKNFKMLSIDHQINVLKKLKRQTPVSSILHIMK
jgi:hypothetical protein